MRARCHRIRVGLGVVLRSIRSVWSQILKQGRVECNYRGQM